MKRIMLVVTVALMMAAMLAMGASPAMAKNEKLVQGEPLFSGNTQNLVFHCGPFFEAFGVEDLHGAFPFGNNGVGGNRVQAPR